MSSKETIYVKTWSLIVEITLYVFLLIILILVDDMLVYLRITCFIFVVF